MAYWAELNENNEVIRITVGSDEEQDKGYAWILENLGGRWVETNDANSQYQLALVGQFYYPEFERFADLKPFDSWIFNIETGRWEAPVKKPPGIYEWDESIVNWVEVQGE